MPASWHARTVAAASPRAGSRRATSPSRVSSRSHRPGSVSWAGGRSRRVTARTRAPPPARSSARAMAAATTSSEAARTCVRSSASGAPLHSSSSPPSRRCTVLIRRRSLSNGSSATRWAEVYRSSRWMSWSAAATSNATSVGSPRWCPSSASFASLHRAAASNSSPMSVPSAVHRCPTVIRPRVRLGHSGDDETDRGQHHQVEGLAAQGTQQEHESGDPRHARRDDAGQTGQPPLQWRRPRLEVEQRRDPAEGAVGSGTGDEHAAATMDDGGACPHEVATPGGRGGDRRGAVGPRAARPCRPAQPRP